MVEKKVTEKQKEVKEFRTAHGDTKVGEVTVNMVLLTCSFVNLSVYTVA